MSGVGQKHYLQAMHSDQHTTKNAEHSCGKLGQQAEEEAKSAARDGQGPSSAGKALRSAGKREL